jgi:hypothetical protein
LSGTDSIMSEKEKKEVWVRVNEEAGNEYA